MIAGPVFSFGNEQVPCTNACESTVGTYHCKCAQCASRAGVVFIAMRLPPGIDPATAMYGVYSADEARELAASILESANAIDGGRHRQ